MGGIWRAALVLALVVGCTPADDDGDAGDAGRAADAAPPDGGRPDAGRPDRGPGEDAGEADAGGGDASEPDAGEADAAGADAAGADAGGGDAGPPVCGPARLMLTNATETTVRVELRLPGLRTPSVYQLAQGARVHVPVPAGPLTVVARTDTGDAQLDLLDEALELRCGERRSLAVDIPNDRFGAPTARTYRVEGQRPPANPPPFACGADKARAVLEENFDDDANLRVTLTCRLPGNPVPTLHSLDVEFPAPVERSYALYALRRAFTQYLNVSDYRSFQVDTSGPFHPLVTEVPGLAQSKPGFPGSGPSIWLDSVPGGELWFFVPAQKLDGVEIYPDRFVGYASVTVSDQPTVRPMVYRTFAKTPGPQARLRLEWSRVPTPVGKLQVKESCNDAPPPADLITSSVVVAPLDGGDPLYDVVHFELGIPGVEAPETRWVRVTRLDAADQPVDCPTDWIAVNFSPVPTLGGCSDGSPVQPWGCGDPPPPLPDSGFTVQVLQYEPPIFSLAPGDGDFYATLDRYVFDQAFCAFDDDCPGPGESCVDGHCTFNGQSCDPYCQVRGNPLGWPEGCVYRLSQHQPPEPDPSIFEVIFNGLVTVWDYVAQFWNAYVQGIVYVFSGLIPGCDAECHLLPGMNDCPEEANLCGKLMEAAVHAGLVALGVPPQAPSFERLMDEGSDYLAELAAEAVQDATGVPSAVSQPIIQKATNRVAAELKEAARAHPGAPGDDPRTWGSPSPWHTYHPARVYLRVRRNNAPGSYAHLTLMGGLLFWDVTFRVPRGMSPGESVDVALQLDPRIYLPIGEFATPDYGRQAWLDEKYANGAGLLDLRIADAVVAGVPAGQGWPGPVPIPTCE